MIIAFALIQPHLGSAISEKLSPGKLYMHVCEGSKRKTNLKIVALIINHYMYHGFLRRLLSHCHPK